MSMQPVDRDQLLDLLIRQSTEGLDAAETHVLERLLAAQDELSVEEMDAAVAAILLAAESDPATRSPAMPAELSARILAKASGSNVIPLSGRPVSSPESRSRQGGWWAAAACAALAVWGWWPRLVSPPVEPVTTPMVAKLTPEQERARLLSSGHAIQASWSPGGDAGAEALTGDVVFDPVTQRGYLLFKGIRANDPRLEQYQLWIADAARTPPEPVDGGVFNAPQSTATGDVIIPFEAKLPVGKPAAFVVTVEQPGGVVVSKQDRVLALAKVSAN